jgi:hypothetical protein
MFLQKVTALLINAWVALLIQKKPLAMAVYCTYHTIPDSDNALFPPKVFLL